MCASRLGSCLCIFLVEDFVLILVDPFLLAMVGAAVLVCWGAFHHDCLLYLYLIVWVLQICGVSFLQLWMPVVRVLLNCNLCCSIVM